MSEAITALGATLSSLEAELGGIVAASGLSFLLGRAPARWSQEVNVITTDYRVLLSSRGDWIVKCGGVEDGEVVSRRALREEAVSRGRALALVNRPSRLLVYGSSGTVELEWTYTRTPRPPAD